MGAAGFGGNMISTDLVRFGFTRIEKDDPHACYKFTKVILANPHIPYQNILFTNRRHAHKYLASVNNISRRVFGDSTYEWFSFHK
jgi:hypothetical protein